MLLEQFLVTVRYRFDMIFFRSFGLCLLVFLGNMIQGFGLLQNKLTPKWASLSFIIGNILILVFPGVENWMAIGSLMMMIGLLPLFPTIED